MNNKILGNLGEKIAQKYIEKLGYKVIANNFRCKSGEIDLIAIENNECIFIEVKTRVNNKFGYPIEAVNSMKQKHLKRSAKYFVYKYQLEKSAIRFDIIEVYYYQKKYYIKHIKNVLW